MFLTKKKSEISKSSKKSRKVPYGRLVARVAWVTAANNFDRIAPKSDHRVALKVDHNYIFAYTLCFQGMVKYISRVFHSIKNQVRGLCVGGHSHFNLFLFASKTPRKLPTLNN